MPNKHTTYGKRVDRDSNPRLITSLAGGQLTRPEWCLFDVSERAINLYVTENEFENNEK